MALPPITCESLPGSSAQAFVLEGDPETDPLVWDAVSQIQTYTMSTDTDDTDMSNAGVKRSLPMQRGYSLQLEGQISAGDIGQTKLDGLADELGCDSLVYVRFLIPAPGGGTTPARDLCFPAWVEKGDEKAGPTDNFSWSVTLHAWEKPITTPVAA